MKRFPLFLDFQPVRTKMKSDAKVGIKISLDVLQQYFNSIDNNSPGKF